MMTVSQAVVQVKRFKAIETIEERVLAALRKRLLRVELAIAILEGD